MDQSTYKEKSSDEANLKQSPSHIPFTRKARQKVSDIFATGDLNSGVHPKEANFNDKGKSSNMLMAKDSYLQEEQSDNVIHIEEQKTKIYQKKSTNYQLGNPKGQKLTAPASKHRYHSSMNSQMFEDQQSQVMLEQQAIEETLPVLEGGQDQKQQQQQQQQQQETERDKYALSVDQYKSYQNIKNPMSKYQLLLMSIAFLIAIIGAFPISLEGIYEDKCDVNTNYEYHFIYLVFVILVLLTSDVSAMITNAILYKKQQQSQLVLINYNDKEFSTTGLICDMFLAFLNLFASASYIYEFYSDLIIIWIGTFSSDQVVFGFFAVIFPLLNRLLQLYIICRLFIFGLKQFRKTVSNERIDQNLLFLNLFNVSKQLYPKMMNPPNSKILTIITVKECSLKMIQIILKLIIATDVLNKNCSQNTTVMVIMISLNLISLIQLVFFMTERGSLRAQNALSNRNIEDLMKYTENTTVQQEFEVIITDRNQDSMLKNMNNFLIMNRKIKGVSVSFQNKKELIQQRYRECFLRMFAQCQENNIRIKEVRIFNSKLSLVDFNILKRIIISIPRLQRLHLQNITITEKELECLDTISEGIERSKYFKELIMEYTTSDKDALYEKVLQMLSLNKSISVQYIDTSNIESGALFESADIDAFYKIRCQQRKNLKLFTFRDWENILKQLMLKSLKELDLTQLNEIPTKYQTNEYLKREKTAFIQLIKEKLLENRQVESLKLVYGIEVSLPRSLTMTNNAKLPLSEVKDSHNKYQIQKDLQCNDSKFKLSKKEVIDIMKLAAMHSKIPARLKQFTLSHDSDALIDYSQDLIDVLNTTLLINLKNLRTLKLSNINLQQCSDGLFSQIKEVNKCLSALNLTYCNISNIDLVKDIVGLENVDFSHNKIEISDHIVLQSILRCIKNLNLSHNSNLITKLRLDQLDLKDSVLEKLKLSSITVSHSAFMTLAHCLITQCNNLSQLELQECNINDQGCDVIADALTQRIKAATKICLDLSRNKIQSKYTRLLESDKLCKLWISYNDISSKHFNSLTMTNYTLEMIDLSGEALQAQTLNQFHNLSLFTKLGSLNLSGLGLEVKTVVSLVKCIEEFRIPIHTIILSKNHVGYQGCKQLNLLGQRHNKLKVLILDYAKIQCIGLTYLWLAYNDPDRQDMILDHLSVRGNNINPQWAVRLNFKMSNPLRIRHLDLGENTFNDKAAKEIQVYFTKNKHIEVLDLSYNSIMRVGIRRLKELIRVNSNMKTLIFKGNPEIEKNIELCERRQRYSETSQRIVYF